MRKRGLGLLLILTFVAAAAAVVQAFRFDLSITRERTAAVNVDRTLGTIEVALANLRAAQAAYLAAGQSPDFWMTRASDLAAEVDGRITGLQSATVSESARSHYEAAAVALANLTDLDRKARSDVTNGERLMASDVIFMDSLEASRRLDSELIQARDVESAGSITRVTALRQRQLAITGGALGLVLLVAIVLYRRIPGAAAMPAAVVEQPLSVESRPVEDLPLVRLPEPRAFRPAETMLSGVNLSDAAEICVDLARVLDARDVPPLLARAADVLEATGMIVWVANSTRTVLHPSLSHGYPDRVLQRLGALAVDADNATSLAFRSMRVQVINSRSFGANGAIAVPLITSTGCVGVLAAEVKHATPGNDTLAVARMMAAQLATLVAPVADAPAQTAAQG